MTDLPQPPPDSSRPSSDVTALLAELARVIKGRRFYGPGSPRLAKLFERAVRAWQADLERHGDFDVSVVDSGFIAPGAPAEPLSGQLATLHGALVQRGIERLRVEAPLEADGFAALLEILVSDAAGLAEEGGVERALYSRAPVGFVINGIAPASAPPMASESAPPAEPQASADEASQPKLHPEPVVAAPTPTVQVAPLAAAASVASAASTAAATTPSDPEATDPMLDWAPPPDLDSALAPEPEREPEPALAPEPEPEPREASIETASPVPPVEPEASEAAPGAVQGQVTRAVEPPPAVAPDAMPPIPSALLEEAAVQAGAAPPAEDLDAMDFAVDLPGASAPEIHETPAPDPVPSLPEESERTHEPDASDAPAETIEASEPPPGNTLLAEDSGDMDLPVLAEPPAPDADADLPALADESECDPDADTLSRKTPFIASADAPAPVENPAFSFMDAAPSAESPEETTQPDPEPLSAALSDFELEPLEDSSPNLDGPAFAPVPEQPESALASDALALDGDPAGDESTEQVDFDDSVDAGESFEAEVRDILDLGSDGADATDSEISESDDAENPELGNPEHENIEFETPEFETPGLATSGTATADAATSDPGALETPELDPSGFELDDAPSEELGEPADESFDAVCGDGEEIGLDFGGESLELDETAADPDALAAPTAEEEAASPDGGDEEPLEFGFDDDARAPLTAASEADPDPPPPEAPDVARVEPEIESGEAAAPEAAPARPEPEQSPDYVFEILSELEECDDPILYQELAQRAAEAAGRLVEKSFSAEAFTVLRTLAAHASDSTKRSADQRSAADGQMLSLARGPLLAELIQRACSDGDGNLEANQVLLQLGGDATLPVFKTAAVERNAERRERLHGVLIALGEDSLPDLLRLMRDADPVQVRTAVRLAGEIQNPGAVPRLAELLDQPVAALSQEVCKALVRIGDAAALNVLCDGLVSGTEHVPALAAYGLGSSGSPMAGAALLQALHVAMDGGKSEFARELIRALGRLGRPEATSDLAGILLRGGLWQRRRHRELKLAAAAALGRLPGDEAVGALAQAAQSRDAHIRRAAQVALDRRAQALAQG